MDFQNVVMGGLKLTEPASSDSIKDAEKKLGVKLPGDYKNFTQAYFFSVPMAVEKRMLLIPKKRECRS